MRDLTAVLSQFFDWVGVDPVISATDLVLTEFIQWTELTDMFPDVPTADAAPPRDTVVGTPIFRMNADFANLTDTSLFMGLKLLASTPNNSTWRYFNLLGVVMIWHL